jgi:mannose-6-phosphate isomerase-like protein (cupin superfamily)
MKTCLFNRRTALQQLAVAVGAGMISTSTALAGKMNHLPGPKPLVILPGAGEKGSFGGIDAIFKLDKTHTAGNLGIVEMTVKPGYLAAPPHLHHNFDEICYLQEGSLNVMIGKEVTEIHAGSWHVRPRGIIHTFWNSGKQPAKVIELYTPGGFEAYLKDLAELFKQNPNPPAPKIQSLAAKYDMVIHFELLKGIMDKYQVHL